MKSLSLYSCLSHYPREWLERPLFVLGPCVIESRNLLEVVAAELCRLRDLLQVVIIFKASYDKANRTSMSSFRGPGMEEGLELLAEIRESFRLPILTDVHESHHVSPASQVADILQIPAFLCRQTDLLVAAAATGKSINIKKGQFMSPDAMLHSVEKVRGSGNQEVFLTERGTSFGHGDLVVDFRGFPRMRAICPLIFDATHSVQRPSLGGNITGGNRGDVKTLAQAAAAVGVDGFFLEVHPDPDRAQSDGPNMVRLADLECLLRQLIRLNASAQP